MIFFGSARMFGFMITFDSINARCDRVTLIGMMGTGKSKFGRLVANNLGFNFYDVDTLIEKKLKTTIKRMKIYKEKNIK